MTAKKASPQRGKRVTMYLRDEDREKVRQLMADIALQGERVSESLIVRAAILAAEPGKKFLTAYKQAASVDLRFNASE
ncbi:hypothetical protein [Terriglobus sp. RCC_193]|uniref:hypothetical protein n=1 Tax=Terriglobus sp. RCC_193 TaxID=3239218 RepID=UPI0035267D89